MHENFPAICEQHCVLTMIPNIIFKFKVIDLVGRINRSMLSDNGKKTQFEEFEFTQNPFEYKPG